MDELSITAVRQADERRYRAMLEGDLQALERLLDDDLAYTHSSALREGKREYLASLSSGRFKYLGVAQDEVRVLLHGDLAVMDGKVVLNAVVEGTERRLDNRFLSVWRHSAIGWQMLAWASTPVPGRSF